MRRDRGEPGGFRIYTKLYKVRYSRALLPLRQFRQSQGGGNGRVLVVVRVVVFAFLARTARDHNEDETTWPW